MSSNLDIDPAEAERIERVIADSDSPVGINAKKTHILIIRKLLDIETRLENLEKSIEK